MEMLLNKFKTVFFIVILLLQACKGDSQKIITNKESFPDFLKEEYVKQNGYRYIIDESNTSDHPLFSYLDCKKEGYFTVHFIPKEKELQGFWKNEYFKKYYNDNNLDEYVNNENVIIKNLIKDKYYSYNIFTYYFPKKYLTIDKCTIESVSCKANSIANIYFYNQENKEWNKVKDIPTESLPPYANNEFFISKFPKYFPDISLQDQPTNTVNSEGNYKKTPPKWYGRWGVDCRNNLTGLDINKDWSYLLLYSNALGLWVSLKENSTKKDSYFIQFDSVNAARVTDVHMDDDENYSKEKNIAEITFKDKNTMEMKWYGLYNTRTKQIEFLNNAVFIRENGGKNPIIFRRCKE